MSRALTDKQRLFVEAYLGEAGLNATQAARLAGYKAKDDANFAVIGSENLRIPKIAAYIAARMEAAIMSANEVMWRLSQQARGDIADFLDAKNKLDLEAARRNGKTSLIKKLKQRKLLDGLEEVEIELYDAQAALVHVGKYHKLFTDRVEHDTSDELKAYLARYQEMLQKAYGQEDAGTAKPA